MLSAFRASGLGFRFGLTPGFGCFNGLAFPLGLASGHARLFFKTPSVAPPALVHGVRGKGCNVSRIGCDLHVSTRGWIS